MGPIPHSDGRDPPGLVDQVVPCVAGGVENGVVDFRRRCLRSSSDGDTARRFRPGSAPGISPAGDRCDVFGHVEPAGECHPALSKKHRVCARRRSGRDFVEVEFHARCRIGAPEGSTLSALGRSRRTDNRGVSLRCRRAWSRSAPGPLADEAVLLADPGFVLEPDFYGVGSGNPAR